MTIQHIDVDSNEFDDAPKALRDYAKQLKKQLDAVSTERDSFRSQAQSQALGGVLAEFKNPNRVQSALLADQVDPLNEAAVKAWLAENGDDYAKASANPAPPVQEQQHQEAQAGLQAIQQVAGDADPAEAASRFQKAQAEIDALGNKADGAAVAAIYRKHGV